MALAALDLVAREGSLAFSGALELGNNRRLVELGDCAEICRIGFDVGVSSRNDCGLSRAHTTVTAITKSRN